LWTVRLGNSSSKDPRKTSWLASRTRKAATPRFRPVVACENEGPLLSNRRSTTCIRARPSTKGRAFVFFSCSACLRSPHNFLLITFPCDPLLSLSSSFLQSSPSLLNPPPPPSPLDNDRQDATFDHEPDLAQDAPTRLAVLCQLDLVLLSTRSAPSGHGPKAPPSTDLACLFAQLQVHPWCLPCQDGSPHRRRSTVLVASSSRIQDQTHGYKHRP